MATFECPNCQTRVDEGDIPDHLTDMRHNSFEYECKCGCTFSVDVDWEAIFYVLKDTVTLPEPVGAAQGGE